MEFAGNPPMPLSESGIVPRNFDAWLEGLPAVQGYPSGAELCKQGANTPEAYLIVSGLIKLAAIGSGGQQMLAGLRPAGRMIGLASFFLREPHAFSATTIGACCLRRVPFGLLVEKIEAEPEFGRYLHEELSRESYDQATQLVRLGTMTARDRLIRILGQIAGANIELAGLQPTKLPPLLKNWEIAQLAMVTPQHLSVLLKDLESIGLISREKGWLIIHPSFVLGTAAKSNGHHSHKVNGKGMGPF